MTWKKSLVIFGFTVLGQFYSAFVLMNLWNWFVIRLGAPEVRYWTVYGLVLIVNLFHVLPNLYDDARWKRLYIMLDACVRDSQREAMADFLKELNTEENSMAVWMTLQTVVSSSIALGVGWLVHAL